MCTFPSSPQNVASATAPDLMYILDPSSMPQLEHKSTLGLEEYSGFAGTLFDMEFTNGFGSILNHDHAQFQHEDTLTLPMDSEQTQHEEGLGTNSYIDPCIKKLSHNANERQRRKKLNALYTQLRALLPNPNPKRKLSIPNTVCRVLKYIPDLRNEIAKLRRQRDKLLRIFERPVVATKSKPRREHSLHDGLMCSPPYVAVNSAALKFSEVVVTIYTCRAACVFSSLLVLIEEEGFEVLDASTFVSGENVCRVLHLQMISRSSKMEMEVLEKKILFLCEKSSAVEL